MLRALSHSNPCDPETGSDSPPGFPVRGQTLAAAVAPPTGGAGVVRREPADAAEVAGGQRGGGGRRRQVAGLRLLRQVLPIRRQIRGQLAADRKQSRIGGGTHLLFQQRGEVLPKALLKVITPRLPLLLLWTHRDRGHVYT